MEALFYSHQKLKKLILGYKWLYNIGYKTLFD